MKLLRCCLAILTGAFALVPSLHAQQGAVYGTVGLATYGYDLNNNASFANKGNTVGITGGGFINFPISSRLKPAIDARLAYSPGNKGGTTGLIAFRLAFVPNKNRLRPYFEIGGGLVSTTYTTFVGSSVGVAYYTQRATSGAAMLDFGLDIRLTDHLDLRALDYGAAAANRAATGFLNTGVVYHF